MFNHHEVGFSGLLDELLRLGGKRIVTTMLTQAIDMGFVRLSVVTVYARLADEYRTLYSISWRLGQANSDVEISDEYDFNVGTSMAIILYQHVIREIIKHTAISSVEISEILENKIKSIQQNLVDRIAKSC